MGEVWNAEVVVIGAGAAGLWAAERAARAGRDVLVLEKTPRTGTKVLASGGTRCNLTTTLGPADAARLFGPRGERFLRHAFHELTPHAVRAQFAAWGVPTEEAPLEKVFPSSGNARDVRDALESAARGAGARIVTDAPVRAVARDGDLWSIEVEGERSARATRVVLAAGGKSYPRTGTTGDGYAWLAALDLPLVQPVPALVPLTSPAAWVRELTGIDWQMGEVTLENAAGKRSARRRRPLLFTHSGVSGPAAMDVAHHVARAAPSGRFTLFVDLFPEVSREELRERLVASAGAKGAPRLDRILPAAVPKRLLAAVLASAGLGADVPRANELARPARHRMVETLKGLPIPIDGTRGWHHAEVTAGGLDLRALNPRTMAVNAAPGLFVCGELLDVDGPIGGLSFQAAFATAELAARAAAG